MTTKTETAVDAFASLCKYGATQTGAIAKAGVSYSLGAAIFNIAYSQQHGEVSHGRRAAYEGGEPSKKTEHHWRLGVAIAAKYGDFITTALVTANDKSATALVKKLGDKMLLESRECKDKDGNTLEICDKRGAIVWDRLSAFVYMGTKAKDKKSVAERGADMVARPAKLAEDATSIDDCISLAVEMDKLAKSAAAAAAALRKRADHARILAEALANGVAAPAEAPAEAPTEDVARETVNTLANAA